MRQVQLSYPHLFKPVPLMAFITSCCWSPCKKAARLGRLRVRSAAPKQGVMSPGGNLVFKKSIGILLLFFPLLTWALYKPVRIVAPELNGVNCSSEKICVDDISKFDEVRHLYESSLLAVRKNAGALDKNPLIVFCSSLECSNAFGLGNRSAMHLPVGIVISPRAWKKYYISHELIHQLQQQEFGFLYFFQKPKWYIEGMAYSLSQDPRATLNEPFQEYRQTFNAWLQKVGIENLWVLGHEL